MIRCAAAADVPRIRQILKKSETALPRPMMESWMDRQKKNLKKTAAGGFLSGLSHIYVYDDDGVIKGMISWEQSEPVCERKHSELCCYSDLCCYEKYASCSVEILGVYVDPAYRGTGIGKLMMNSFLKNMQYQDIRCASMWILDHDAVGAEFCMNFGFNETPDVKELPNGLRFVKYIHQYY